MNFLGSTMIYYFILYMLYLSSQITLTGYIFVIYCHWQKYSFSGTTIICYLLSVVKLLLNPVHFLLTENIRRGNQGILPYFFYICILTQNINVDGLMWFFCRINTILMQCLKIYRHTTVKRFGASCLHPSFQPHTINIIFQDTALILSISVNERHYV